jgi:hypothetical protein
VKKEKNTTWPIAGLLCGQYGPILVVRGEERKNEILTHIRLFVRFLFSGKATNEGKKFNDAGNDNTRGSGLMLL